MSIRNFLGLPEKPRSSAEETDIVRHVVSELDHLDEEKARFIASFGYLLGRIAHADLSISPEETAAMEDLIVEHGGLPKQQAIIVAQIAKTRAQLFGGTENFLVTREFDRTATKDEKLHLLDCLFAVAAAEGHISQTEDNEIRQISNELHLDHPDFIQVRSRWKSQLKVLMDLPSKPE